MSTQVAQELQKILSDTFVLYFKTHAYHWNVEGPQFKSLHELFEEQYTEMWEAIDDIAERLRALGEYAPISIKSMMENAAMQETGQTPDAMTMVANLAEGNIELSTKLNKAIKAIEDSGDEVTIDLFIGRATIHDKNAWMLRATGK